MKVIEQERHHDLVPIVPGGTWTRASPPNEPVSGSSPRPSATRLEALHEGPRGRRRPRERQRPTCRRDHARSRGPQRPDDSHDAGKSRPQLGRRHRSRNIDRGALWSAGIATASADPSLSASTSAARTSRPRCWTATAACCRPDQDSDADACHALCSARPPWRNGGQLSAFRPDFHRFPWRREGRERWSPRPISEPGIGPASSSSMPLARQFRVPARMLNDAAVHGLGVVEGHGLECVITLGTGIGCALFRNRRLLLHLELGQHLPGGRPTISSWDRRHWRRSGRKRGTSGCAIDRDHCATNLMRRAVYWRGQRAKDHARAAGAGQDREQRGRCHGRRPACGSRSSTSCSRASRMRKDALRRRCRHESPDRRRRHDRHHRHHRRRSHRAHDHAQCRQLISAARGRAQDRGAWRYRPTSAAEPSMPQWRWRGWASMSPRSSSSARTQRAETVLSHLLQEGVSTRWALRDGRAPTGASVLVSSHDRNAAIFTFRGANTLLEDADLRSEAFAVDVVYVSSLSNESADAFPAVIRQAKAQGALVATNPRVRQLSSRGQRVPGGARPDRHPGGQSHRSRCAGARSRGSLRRGWRALPLEPGETPPRLLARGLIGGGHEMSLAAFLAALRQMGSALRARHRRPARRVPRHQGCHPLLSRARDQGRRNGGRRRCLQRHVHRVYRDSASSRRTRCGQPPSTPPRWSAMSIRRRVCCLARGDRQGSRRDSRGTLPVRTWSQ